MSILCEGLISKINSMHTEKLDFNFRLGNKTLNGNLNPLAFLKMVVQTPIHFGNRESVN